MQSSISEHIRNIPKKCIKIYQKNTKKIYQNISKTRFEPRCRLQQGKPSPPTISLLSFTGKLFNQSEVHSEVDRNMCNISSFLRECIRISQNKECLRALAPSGYIPEHSNICFNRLLLYPFAFPGKIFNQFEKKGSTFMMSKKKTKILQ